MNCNWQSKYIHKWKMQTEKRKVIKEIEASILIVGFVCNVGWVGDDGVSRRTMLNWEQTFHIIVQRQTTTFSRRWKSGQTDRQSDLLRLDKMIRLVSYMESIWALASAILMFKGDSISRSYLFPTKFDIKSTSRDCSVYSRDWNFLIKCRRLVRSDNSKIHKQRHETVRTN